MTTSNPDTILKAITRLFVLALLVAVPALSRALPPDSLAVCPPAPFGQSGEMAEDTAATDTFGVLPPSALPWPQSLQANIDSIVSASRFLKTSQLGMMVYDLTADSVLYARGERQTLRPASTMKLLTAVTALDKLGGAYLYKTRLCYTGTVADSVRTLNGHLYVIGGMDPRFGHDDLRSFVLAVKELGIDTIRGNVFGDRSMKNGVLLGEGWCWDDDNPVLIPLLYGRKDNLLSKFADALADEGIYLDGELKTDICPAGAKEICVRTHTIEQILNRMMKDSDNLYAETMFYHIGLTKGKPSTAAKAKAVMEALLRKIGLAKSPHRFADGSGLSLYNYVSAEIEVGFLRYAFDNPDIYANLLPALPIAAVDGTLERRMANTPAAGNVRAKTGTLTGINSLAGYCTASNGHELCFSIINQGIMSSGAAKTFQNRICAELCK